MSDASLRYELAGELGQLVYERQEIVSLAQAYAPGVDIADLPQGSARTIWVYLLVALANRADGAAVAELIREGRERSRRVDWSRFDGLAAAPAPQPPVQQGAATLWSHIGVELRWQNESDGSRDAVRAARDPQILEATVTQQWAGLRPADPSFEAVVAPLLGPAIPVPNTWRSTALSNVDNVACWSSTFPVAPGRLRSRRVEVTVAGNGQRRRGVRYLVPELGSLLTLGLWLSLAGFLLYWLSPLGVRVSATGLGLWLVSFGLGWLAPRAKQLLGRWGWLTQAWEATLPIVGAAGALAVVLPPQLFVSVYNFTPDATTLDDTKLAAGEHQTVWRGSAKLKGLERSQCVCPTDTHCPCTQHDTRWVPHLEIACRQSDGREDTGAIHCPEYKSVKLSDLATSPVTGLGGEARVPLDWPAGFSAIEASIAALRDPATVASAEERIQLIPRVAAEVSGAVQLRLRSGNSIAIDYADGEQLRCSLPPDGERVRIDTFEVAAVASKMSLGVGRVSSEWPVTSKRVGHVCLGHGELATLNVASPARGLRLPLPFDLGITHVVLNHSERLACAHPDALRVIDLQGVPDKYDAMPAASLWRRLPSDTRSLGITCGAINSVVSLGDGYQCRLDVDKVECERRLACALDRDNNPVFGDAAQHCQPLNPRTDSAAAVKKRAKQAGVTCISEHLCL